MDNNGNNIKVKGIPRKVTIREIYALQMKISVRKLCKVFAIYIMNDKGKRYETQTGRHTCFKGV